MSFSARLVPLLLFTLLSVAIPLRAQSQTKAPPAKTPQGVVSGRVTIKDKPAPGVVVGLRKLGGFPAPESFFKATTDQEGVYRITNVPPGTYDVAPSAPAYVVADLNNMRGKNVIVGESEEVENINFSLVRGGVITGKVTDADGRVLIAQQVNIYRAGDFAQQPLRQVFPTTNVQTDDRGIYRFFGLAAGRYKVASGRGSEIYGGTFTPMRIIYKQVFHPDTPDQEKATIVEVREGGEATNVDITLGRPVQTFSVSGRVVDSETGTPVPNVRFGFQRSASQGFEIGDTSGFSNSNGDFTVDGFSPGRYGVFLFPEQNPVLRAETMSFEIVDSDINNLTIRLTKGATVSGMIVFEHEDKKAFARLLELKLRGYVTSPAGASVVGASAAGAISPDGSFNIAGLSAGTLNLWLSTETGNMTPKGFTISRVEHNGILLPNGIKIEEGEQVMGVRVFVTYGTASIRGAVNFENGVMPEGGRMWARLAKPGTPVPIWTTLVDARGNFLMEGVAAGVYEVSVQLMVPGSRMPPQNLKQQVTVQDGAVTEVSMTINMAAEPPQKP